MTSKIDNEKWLEVTLERKLDCDGGLTSSADVNLTLSATGTPWTPIRRQCLNCCQRLGSQVHSTSFKSMPSCSQSDLYTQVYRVSLPGINGFPVLLRETLTLNTAQSPGFLNSSTADILGCLSLCCGGCSVPCMMSRSIPGLLTS